MNFAPIEGGEPKDLLSRRLLRMNALLALGHWNDETLHQLRVSMRAIQAWLPVLENTSPHLKSLSRPLTRWLKAGSAARDRDVFRSYLQSLPNSQRARRLLQEQRKEVRPLDNRALGKLVSRLTSRLDHWRAWTHPSLLYAHLELLLPLYIYQVQDRGQRALAHPDKQLHSLRLAVKRLRYLLELMADIQPDYVLYHETCRRWQERLGQFSDLDALLAWLSLYKEQKLAKLVTQRRRALVHVLLAEIPEQMTWLNQLKQNRLPSSESLQHYFSLSLTAPALAFDIKTDKNL